MEQLIWRTVIFTNGKYEVSQTGKIRAVFSFTHWGEINLSGKILKTSINIRGYEIIGFSWEENGRRYEKTFKVHRLVCEAFHPNPDNKPEVNHKDLNQLNNHYLNLEWATGKENASHAHKNKVFKRKKRNNKRVYQNNNSVLIDMYSPDMVFLKTYNGIKKASLEIGISISNISRVLNGDQKTAGGFKWKYSEDTTSQLL